MANYAFWQQQGPEWADEYDIRKKVMIKYHIQELMLAEYFSHSAPSKILEFGCGVGRHLSYLTQIPGLEVHGYDQSAGMASGCLRWTTQDWIDEHITIGPPVGSLPYPDQFFDIVYTAEVLVHVRPEDLGTILAELIRISKYQVFHMETSPHYELNAGAHAGCWYHDLVAAYQQLGQTCEMMTSGFVMHSPYRVVLDASRPPYEFSPVQLALFRRMEKDIEAGFAQEIGKARSEAEARAQDLQVRIDELSATLAERDLWIERAAGTCREMEGRKQELKGQVDQLNTELAKRDKWIAAAAETFRELDGKKQELQAQVDQLNTELAGRDKWIAEAAKTCQALEDKLQAAEAQIRDQYAAAEKQLGMLDARRQELEQSYAVLRDDVERAGQIRVQMEEYAAALQAELDCKEQEVCNAIAVQVSLQEQIGHLEKALQEKQLTIDTLNDMHEKKQQDLIEYYKSREENLKQARREAEFQKLQLQQLHEDLAKELNVTRKEIEALKREKDAVLARQNEFVERIYKVESTVFTQDSAIRRQHSLMRYFISQIQSELSRTR